MKKLIYTLLILSLTFVAGCGGGGATSGGNSDLTSTPIDDNGNPEEGTVTDDSFYVRNWDNGDFEYVLWSPDTTDGSCEIANSITGEDIFCIMDVQEGDLWFHGVKFQYNIPKGMCAYFGHEPYWYYYEETGYGPSALSVGYDTNADGDYIAGSLDCDDGSGAPVTDANSCSYKEVDVTIGTGGSPEITCAYDHRNSNGPNCCFGEYTYTSTVTSDKGGPEESTKTTSSETQWSSPGIKGCLAGPAVNNWESFDYETEIPITSIRFSKIDGINDTFLATPPYKGAEVTRLSHNIYAANYFDYQGVSHLHDGYVSSRVSNAPYAVDPIDDRNGTLMYSGQPYYYFGCLDPAFDYVNRIRVMIREWNTTTEFTQFLTDVALDDNKVVTTDPTASTANPDVQGKDESACAIWDSQDYCNDKMDWADVLNNITNHTSAAYPDLTYDTNPASTSDRSEFFPGADRQYPYNP